MGREEGEKGWEKEERWGRGEGDGREEYPVRPSYHTPSPHPPPKKIVLYNTNCISIALLVSTAIKSNYSTIKLKKLPETNYMHEQ